MDPVHSLADAAVAASSSTLVTTQQEVAQAASSTSGSGAAITSGPSADSVSTASSPTSPMRSDETSARHVAYLPSASPFVHTEVTPPRKDTLSSISTQATTATMASTESNNTSYSAETSPSLHQSIFSVKDGSDVSNTRRASRRRTGPLSQQSRERAALIRKLGACHDCRRRRVACHPSHHNMTWDDLVARFHRAHSPNAHDVGHPLGAGRPLSPSSSMSAIQPSFGHDSREMDIDSTASVHHHPGRPPLSDARIRTPLPSGPRLEKSLSLPGIDSLRSELQGNVPRVLSTSNRGRYSSVQALLLFWQDDDQSLLVQDSVRELAQVFEKYYHYTSHIQAIPSSSDGFKSSWRWLSRQLNDFAEDRDQRDVLKIVYYIGHTYLDGNRDMILASSKDVDRASTIRWSGMQQILEEGCADTLIMMDAPYFPTGKIVRQKGVLELLAASISDDHTSLLERCAFTRTLTEQLKTRAARSSALSAVELHALLLSQYPKLVRDGNPEKEMITTFPAPFHTMVSGNSRLPSIFLAPVYQNNSLRSSFSFENNPQLHLTIKLTDDNVDVESWNEWLRLMPDGVKDVKIDGPFRPSFR